MGKKEEKAVVRPEQKTVTKVGYVAIYRGTAYGEREISADDPILYEDKNECLDETKDDNGFTAIAKVTWEEPA